MIYQRHRPVMVHSGPLAAVSCSAHRQEDGCKRQVHGTLWKDRVSSTDIDGSVLLARSPDPYNGA